MWTCTRPWSPTGCLYRASLSFQGKTPNGGEVLIVLGILVGTLVWEPLSPTLHISLVLDANPSVTSGSSTATIFRYSLIFRVSLNKELMKELIAVARSQDH